MKRITIILVICIALKATAQEGYSEKIAKTAMSLWSDTSTTSPNHLPTKWSYDQGVVLKTRQNVR